MANKITLYAEPIKKQLNDIYGDTEYKDAVKTHGDGFVHFIKKELSRKGYDVDIKETGEGSEGEYDDSELDQEQKIKAGSDFVSLPAFVEWFDNPAY